MLCVSELMCNVHIWKSDYEARCCSLHSSRHFPHWTRKLGVCYKTALEERTGWLVSLSNHCIICSVHMLVHDSGNQFCSLVRSFAASVQVIIPSESKAKAWPLCCSGTEFICPSTAKITSAKHNQCHSWLTGR